MSRSPQPAAPAQRSCDGCTLCCKLMGIPELEKQPGNWCRHCQIGTGCAVYADRPQTCRGFMCGYLVWDQVGPHWNPGRCRMVITADKPGQIVVRVDEGRPDIWRQHPFYADLKSWARAGGSALQLLVVSGGRTLAILPDGEVNLGAVSPSDILVTSEYRTPQGVRWTIRKVAGDDPRYAGAAMGERIPAADRDPHRPA